MAINWGALAVVAAVSLAIAVLVVVLVSVALVGLSARELGPTGERRRLSPTAGTVTAVVCLLGAASIVLYGFSMLVF